MKIFIEKAHLSFIRAVETLLKQRYQLSTYNIADYSLNFAKNIQIHGEASDRVCINFKLCVVFIRCVKYYVCMSWRLVACFISGMSAWLKCILNIVNNMKNFGNETRNIRLYLLQCMEVGFFMQIFYEYRRPLLKTTLAWRLYSQEFCDVFHSYD